MKIFLKYLFLIFLISLIKSEVETGTETEEPYIESENEESYIEDGEEPHIEDGQEPYMDEGMNEPQMEEINESHMEEGTKVPHVEQEPQGVRLVNEPDIEEISPNDKVEIKKVWIDEQKRYKKISEDFRIMESHFKHCIDSMQDIDFTEEGVQNCVGINLQRPINDTNYEKKKQIALTETKLKKILFFECYEPAGLDEDWAGGCDVLQKDLLDFLWAELNFYEIIEFNQKKYLYEFAKIPVEAFENVLKEIHILYKSMFDILNEIDVHQDLMVIQIKSYIDKRTVGIRNEIIELKKHPKPVIHKKKIRITQMGRVPKKRLKPEEFPRRIVMDGNPNHMFAKNKGPRVDDLIDFERYSEKRKETPYIQPHGPIVMFPENKMKIRKRYV